MLIFVILPENAVSRMCQKIQAELTLNPVRSCDVEACVYMRMTDASAKLFFMLHDLI